MKLGERSRLRDVIGAVLLVLVGLLYVSDVSDIKGEELGQETSVSIDHSSDEHRLDSTG